MMILNSQQKEVLKLIHVYIDTNFPTTVLYRLQAVSKGPPLSYGAIICLNISSWRFPLRMLYLFYPRYLTYLGCVSLISHRLPREVRRLLTH